MTRLEAIEILRKNRPTSDPRPCGMELCDAVDMAISALLQQESVTRCNGLNEPLTLDELRKMDGEPVWVIYDKGFEPLGLWALVEVREESIFLTNSLGGWSKYAADVELEDNGITVYRRKPEEGTA